MEFFQVTPRGRSRDSTDEKLNGMLLAVMAYLNQSYIRLVKSTAIYGGGDFVALFCATFIVLPLLSSKLEPIEYSHYLSLRAKVDLFILIGHIGIVSGYSRLFFSKTLNGQHALFYTSIYMGGLWLGLIYILIMVFQHLFPVLLATDLDGYRTMVFLIAMSSLVYNIHVTTFRNQNRPYRFLVLQLGNAITLCTTLLLWDLFDKLNIMSVFVALFLSFMLPNLLGFEPNRRMSLELAHKEELAAMSLPIFFGLLCLFMLNKFNLLFLVDKVDPIEYGSYAISVQIGMLLGLVTASVGKAIQPYIWSSTGVNLRSRLGVSSFVLVTILCSTWIGINLGGGLLFALFSPESFILDKVNLLLLTGCTALSGFTLISDSIIILYKKPSVVLFLIVLSVSVTILLSFILVGSMGTRGASLAQFFGMMTFCCLSFFMALKVLKNEEFPI